MKILSKIQDQKVATRLRRHFRLRKRVTGTQERPRASVFRSLKHIGVQLIDDVSGRTVAAVSSQTKELSGQKMAGLAQATKVGELVSQAAKKAGIVKVVFDRGGYKYHGRIKALAEAMRKGGLEF